MNITLVVLLPAKSRFSIRRGILKVYNYFEVVLI